MSHKITESVIEEAALEYFESLGYVVLNGPDISPGELGAERASYADVLLIERLQKAIARLNPKLSIDACGEALRRVREAAYTDPDLLSNNRTFHRLLVEGIPVETQTEDGRIAGDRAWLIDFARVENNDWLVVNQLTVLEHFAGSQAGANTNERRPDIVVFINGLPLGLIELKNAADAGATVKKAWNQLQTYKKDMPSLCAYNEVMVISDGTDARAGTLSSPWERFMPWRTVDGVTLAPKGAVQMETLIKGIFQKGRFLDLIAHFITFEGGGEGGQIEIDKKMAGYHQFHAVNEAVQCTINATSADGDKRAGVVWHTQGSGKSLTMLFYAGKIIQQPELQNPTLVVLTDRNDLDDQLLGTFAKGDDLLRQSPVQAQSRPHLRELLQVASGGVVFTTIQKFLPEERGKRYDQLSDRRNIVFIADEAHRGQYDFIDGFARHMRDALPNASFIGFTGTPIESTDKNTRAVFGEYIDIYDIQQSVDDGATVRIYYEARLAKLQLDESELPKIDPDFEEATEGEEVEGKERLKDRWARLEAMVGAPKRINQLAVDIVEHFEMRREALEGKGMIVGMSRRICAELYDAIIRIRPEWHSENDKDGFLKVIMTGNAADDQLLQPHIRSKSRREALAKTFKDPESSIKLVIVRDMWLTGFDAPSLHTMYVDKPMQGHGLMQAIARVNRVFKDKPGGLIVDYLGLADNLKRALNDYTEGDRDQAGIPQEVALVEMKKHFEVVSTLMYGFNWADWTSNLPAKRLALLPAAMQHILQQDDGKKRFVNAVQKLSQAFALSVPHEDALQVRDDVGFFQSLRATLIKITESSGGEETGDDEKSSKSREQVESAVRQIVSRSVISTEIVDIFHAAGLKSPEISILSDEFLDEVRDLPQKNLAVEALRRLLSDRIRESRKNNVVQSRAFSERLQEAINRYQNRTIDAAVIIEELVGMAKEMRAVNARSEKMGLTEEELAFYDALEVNDSAVSVMGDETLKSIARELVRLVRSNATIDWAVKDSVRARLRSLVKRLLRMHGYPPDKQESATQIVLAQAEQICR